jgi:RNAse (barnase) inhibitor barstar
MKTCVLDGSRLDDAAAVYRELGRVFRFPAHFGNNPDALWDALGEYGGEPVAVVWQNAARSAERLGPDFPRILAVLRKATENGLVTLELA